MKFGIILFFLATFSSIAQTQFEWDFFHPVRQEWMELGAYGSVQEALIRHGELPDPFYGLNEEKFGWIEDHIWKFKSIFSVDKKTLNHDFVEIEFPSLDTYAEVYLNDSLILSTGNAFIPHSAQIKQLLKEGINEIDITFTPPVIYHKDTKEKVGYQLPAPNDVHEIAIAPYVRKPQYQFGWDWALRMNTIGLNKAVKLHGYNNNRIVQAGVLTEKIIESEAEIRLFVEFAAPFNGSILWESGQFGGKEVEVVNGRAERLETLSDVQLWWPKGQGEQILYDDQWSIQVGNSVLERAVRYGVKTSELVQEEDQWGRSYYFKINGRRIFAKGADYIPQEIFPAKVTDESIIHMVNDLSLSNCNMVRVWGGGYYPDDIFFEKCDELGIMVWEDLMFACAMYPGDDAFISNITEEFNYQIPRIAAHPSVVLFNGNNEVEVAWGNWGFQIKYGLYGKSAKEIEAAYDRIFKLTAPSVVEQYSTIPYIHTSPLSNWGKAEYYNYGSQHYWGVWHGKDPLEDFGKKIGRFNAEYGFQSFPEFSTLRSFSDPKTDWSLNSEVMKNHQKSYVGNDMIMKHAKRLYGEPRDFEDFVYYSQLTQSIAVSMAIAGHRLDAPRCGGTVYWQLNDCWPAPTWSSIDYFGNWKALHYRVKDDYREVTVLQKYKDLCYKDYYFIADVPFKQSYDIGCKVISFEGELLGEREFHFDSFGEGDKAKFDIDSITKPYEKINYVVYFTFKDENGEIVTRSFEQMNVAHHRTHDRHAKMEIDRIDEENHVLVLKVVADKSLRNAWLSCNIPGMQFNTNFLHLMPGTHFFQVKYSESPPNLDDFRLMWQ